MAQSWFKPHPLGIYPCGNAKGPEDLAMPRFGSLSHLQCAVKGEAKKSYVVSGVPSEDAVLELFLHLLSFISVPDICRLSTTCTGWYCLIHASEAFKQAHSFVSPGQLRFRGSWKETAIRAYLDSVVPSEVIKRSRTEKGPIAFSLVRPHRPVSVKRAFYSDLLFQAWMCTILPCYYHLRLAGSRSEEESGAAGRSKYCDTSSSSSLPNYRSSLNEVPRCAGLSPEEFRRRFEEPNLPVVLTDIATKWPFFQILQGKFSNFAAKKEALFRSGIQTDVPMRCEHTTMTVDDYVQYALEQSDERPIYMFDSEFGTSMNVEALYSVPEHFSRDDYFGLLGDARPKYRWIIAGPRRGGSSFHVDPNYTNAWNANLTGRKRWILFPPGCIPAGVYPSEDMSEVVTPVSLTEWLLNNYDTSVEKWRSEGYECICDPGDIMFIPCGWWHFVINLEDSVAITQNYVSQCNLPNVLKFLAAMKLSISGIGEDTDDAVGAMVTRRREGFYEEFLNAMRAAHPELMRRVEEDIARDAEERQRRRAEHAPLPMLDGDTEGFTFDF